MRVLFDQGTPVPLRQFLTQHQVSTVYEHGWSKLMNGKLLALAEEAGFTVFVTTDTNLKHQQNLTPRQIAIIALSVTSWPRIQKAAHKIVRAIDVATAGTFTEVEIP